MEVIDLNINGEVVVPEVVEVVGEVKANPINAGVTDIVINGETQPIDNGTVSFSIPTKTSDIENDSGFIDKDVDDLTNYTKSSELAAVATSGDYNDLENKPVIPVVPTNVSDFVNDAGYITKDVDNLTNYKKSSDLATVATTGNYNDLSNKPQIPSKTIVEVNQIQDTGEKIATVTVDGQSTDIYAPVVSTEVVISDTLGTGTKIATITVDGNPTDIKSPTVPTNVSSFTNDSGYITKNVDDLTNYTPSSSLSSVATSGDYDDLQNKPDLSIYAESSSLATVATSGDYDDLQNKPDLSVYAESSNLATVATSGDYDDLQNKPSIPSISGLASETFVTNAVSDHNSSSIAHSDIRNSISTIDGKIPSAASSQNQLADKAFVNSTINSLAAFFRGNYANQNDLLSVAWQTSDPEAQYYVTNNDYAYVQEVVSGSSIGTWDPADHLGEAWRFLYVLGEGWRPQFMVNETPLTQAQLDTLNSGVTANDVAQIGLNTTAIAGKQNVIDANNKLSASYVSGLAAVATSGAYSDITGTPDLSVYAQSANLSTVATSGDYDDLQDKPDLSVYAQSSSLATVATSGDYDDLDNKPDLSIYAESSNLATVATSGDYDDLDNKPDLSVYAESSNLATVATSGDYNDLDNKPSIPTVPTNVSSFNNDAGYITKSVNDLTNYTPSSSLAAVATSGAYSDLSGTPDLSVYAQSANLATVATSGDYDDLDNKPVIPVVPTNVSAFNNDAGYITSAETDVVTTSSSSVAMDPNKYYEFGTLTANTTVTFNSGTTGKVSEYMGIFTAASTYTFTFPAGVTWSDTWTLTAGNTYEFSIINNMGIMVEYQA